jgi:drug/metabolite transporter (DMT)-like permease
MAQGQPTSTGAAGRIAPSGFQLALLALIAGGVSIGLAPIFARFSDVGPLATGGYRMAIAVLSSGLILAASRRVTGVKPGRADLAVGALAGLLFAGDLACYLTALTLTSVAHATLLINLAPVFAILGGWLLLKERPARETLVGMGVALSGAALLALAGRGSSVVTLEGDLIALAGALFYGAYLVALKRARASVSPQALMMVSGTTGALVLLPLSLLIGEAAVPATLTGILALVALGTIAHSLGHGLISQSFSVLPVGYASVVLLVQPTVAAVVAWFVFDEHMSGLELVGAAVTLVGILMASRRRG